MQKWIRLAGLTLDVSIGIHDFEKTGPQPYRLDIGLLLQNNYATKHDQIEEAVDYDLLRNRVIAHLTGRHFNLQETLMQDVVRICFELDPRVIGVDISTAKTAVYQDCEAVGLHYVIALSEYTGA